TASDLRKKLAKITGELDASAQKDVVKRFSLVIDAGESWPVLNLFRASASPQATTHPFHDPKYMDFIWSAAAIQQSGDAIFLGLTAHQWYNRKYDLEGLKPVAHELGYDIFMDECFIRRAIDAGINTRAGARTRWTCLSLNDIRKRRAVLEAELTLVKDAMEHRRSVLNRY
ncbi:hypothetical protein FB451DRAFT_1189082, partial [Mycena latifolia]